MTRTSPWAILLGLWLGSLAAGCSAETAGPTPDTPGEDRPSDATASGKSGVSATPGEPCEPTAAAARGTAVADRFCDDISSPERPVWKAGPPPLPWFDVTAYGAKPDDDACDTAGIQAAVAAACEAGGGVVWAPDGEYRICQAQAGDSRWDWGVLVACDDVHLRGESRQGTVFRGAADVRATNARTMFRFLDAERVSMAQCTVHGAYEAEGRSGWGNGIRGLGVHHGSFVRMRITDHYNHSIALKPSDARSSDDNLIQDLDTERGSQSNIIVFSKAAEFGDVRNKRNRIVDCKATGAQVHYGIEIRYSDDTEIIGGVYAENQNGGINIEEGSRRTRIVGSVMRDNAGNGLKITGNLGRVEDTVCEDCVMEGNGIDGVRNVMGDRVILRGCRIAGNGRHGYVDTPSPEGPGNGTRFEDCEIVGNTEFGIVARGRGHRVDGGTLRDNGAGQGREGIKTVKESEDIAIVNTRFAAEGS